MLNDCKQCHKQLTETVKHSCFNILHSLLSECIHTSVLLTYPVFFINLIALATALQSFNILLKINYRYR